MPKEYSCVKRTKRAFESSLAEISKEYPLNKVTVKMLCEKAELSRNAFYFHYSDINSMVKSIEDGIIDEITENLEDFRKLGFPNNIISIVEVIINIFDKKKNYVLMLFDKSYSANFTQRLYSIFSEFNYEYFRHFHPDIKKSTYEVFYTFLSAGFYDSLRYWLENSESVSKEEVMRITYRLIKRLLLPVDPDLEALTE